MEFDHGNCWNWNWDDFLLVTMTQAYARLFPEALQNGALYIYIYVLYVGLSPLPVRVTTRIITFLVGNPYKPSFPLLLGGGTTQIICMFTQFTPSLGHVTCVHTSHVAFPIFHGLKQITCRMSWRHFCKARKSLGQSLTKSLGNL